jgi:hypothetical protein
VNGINWGLVGPEILGDERRTRTLGLGAAVRTFNDLAVPGLGGVWFGKQLFLALLGVAVAERVRAAGKQVQNIEVSNAVEALACWLALEHNGRKPDPRLRGARKMHGKTDLSFIVVRKPSFYVTQPMRQATVQPLRALNLVKSGGERFNAFSCTDLGRDFIDVTCDGFNPHSRSVLEHLVGWAKDDHDDVKTSSRLTVALSPLNPMSKVAREFLRERLVQPTGQDAARRLAALNWVDELRREPQRGINWEFKPSSLDEAHWRDLYAGALFFGTRDAAIELLDQIEIFIAGRADVSLSLDAPLSPDLADKAERLRQHAEAFLDQKHDPSPSLLAGVFCRECTETRHANLLESLLVREGRVLRLRGRMIVPGASFRGIQGGLPETARAAEEEGVETEVEQRIPLPEGISHRVHNLFLFNLDLRNELDGWLSGPAEHEGAA